MNTSFRLLSTEVASRLLSSVVTDRKETGSTSEEARIVVVGPRAWRVLSERIGSGFAVARARSVIRRRGTRCMIACFLG